MSADGCIRVQHDAARRFLLTVGAKALVLVGRAERELEKCDKDREEGRGIIDNAQILRSQDEELYAKAEMLLEEKTKVRCRRLVVNGVFLPPSPSLSLTLPPSLSLSLSLSFSPSLFNTHAHIH